MLYDDVRWGDTLCDDCRRIPADGLLDGEPLCLSCADQRVERITAIGLNPAMAQTLPPLLDRWNGKGYE